MLTPSALTVTYRRLRTEARERFNRNYICLFREKTRKIFSTHVYSNHNIKRRKARVENREKLQDKLKFNHQSV